MIPIKKNFDYLPWYDIDSYNNNTKEKSWKKCQQMSKENSFALRKNENEIKTYFIKFKENFSSNIVQFSWLTDTAYISTHKDICKYWI